MGDSPKVKIALLDTANLFKIKSNNVTVNQNGVACGGIIGVAAAIHVLREQGFYVIACLEGKNSTYRRRMLVPTYKARRSKVRTDAVEHLTDDTAQLVDSVWQWQAVINLLITLRVPVVYSQGKEADDIIA